MVVVEPLSYSERALVTFLNAPFALVVPVLLAIMAGIMYGWQQFHS